MSSGSHVDARERPVERDGVAECRGGLVRDADAPHVHQQAGVEAVADVAVGKVHPAGEPGANQAGSQRGTGRQAEAEGRRPGIGHRGHRLAAARRTPSPA